MVNTEHNMCMCFACQMLPMCDVLMSWSNIPESRLTFVSSDVGRGGCYCKLCYTIFVLLDWSFLMVLLLARNDASLTYFFFGCCTWILNISTTTGLIAMKCPVDIPGPLNMNLNDFVDILNPSWVSLSGQNLCLYTGNVKIELTDHRRNPFWFDLLSHFMDTLWKSLINLRIG